MESDSTVALAGGGGDRLSKLGDAALGHILSFLPADEGARAATLSRRYRHVFAHVHTVSLDEPEPEPYDEDSGSYSPRWGPCRSCQAKDRAAAFVNRVSAALLGRVGAPLRALRVGFHDFSRRLNAGLVDMWLRYATRQAGGEFHRLDIHFCRGLQLCDRPYALCRPEPPLANDANKETTPPLAAAKDEEDQKNPRSYVYVTPRSIFTCAALRTLRLGSCYLDLPSSAIALPSLDTLHLTGVTGGNHAVQRLVSSCPRLAALTLEACAKVTALSVPRRVRLRALALRCCHDLATVVVADASRLRAFAYRGAVPANTGAGPPFLTLRGGPRTVSSCTLDFCGDEVLDASHLAGLRDMLQLFVGVERLHLTSARLGCGATAWLSPTAFPAFTQLRHLELTGILREDDDTAIDVVTRILEHTPNLEILSLFFMPELEPDESENKYYGHAEEEELLHGHKLKFDEHASLAVPDTQQLPCLRERMKEINFVHYQGGMAQRMLAKFLLRNAPAVDEVCGEFASGPLFLQIKLMEEIKGWVMNKSANMMFF